MIVLTAEIEIKGENASPFRAQESLLGFSLFGESINYEYVVDRSNLLDLNSEIRDRADADQPSFGIFSNGGSLSFKDKNGRFESYANFGILQGGESIKLFLTNTVTKKKEQIGSYFANDWDYDNNNRSITVSFDDGLEGLQEIFVSGIEYDFLRANNLQGESLSWVYNTLYALTPDKYGFLPYEQLDYKTQQKLKVDIRYPFLEGGSLWEQWDKLCKAALLHIYQKNGTTICEYKEGN